MCQFYQNGLVIQLKNIGSYQGIEGENWYLNFMDSDEEIKKYYDENIDVSWSDERYVDCCNNIDYVNLYIKESEKRNINYRLIMCETTREFPNININSNVVTNFIGYDYAYAGGSYYSCINNDVILRNIPELMGLKLNQYGLFDKQEDIFTFIELRNGLKKKYPINTFEDGNFIIYKLSEIKYFI